MYNKSVAVSFRGLEAADFNNPATGWTQAGLDLDYSCETTCLVAKKNLLGPKRLRCT